MQRTGRKSRHCSSRRGAEGSVSCIMSFWDQHRRTAWQGGICGPRPGMKLETSLLLGDTRSIFQQAKHSTYLGKLPPLSPPSEPSLNSPKTIWGYHTHHNTVQNHHAQTVAHTHTHSLTHRNRVPPKARSEPSSLPHLPGPAYYSRPAHRRTGQPPAPRRPITAFCCGTAHTPPF